MGPDNPVTKPDNPVTNPDNPVLGLAHCHVPPQFLTATNPHTNAKRSICREGSLGGIGEI